MSPSDVPRRPLSTATRCARPLRAALGALHVTLFTAALTACAPPFPDITNWDTPLAAGPEADERLLWQKAEEDVDAAEKEGELYESEPLVAYLEAIVALLAPPLPSTGPKLRVRVVRDVDLSAAALADGTILIALPLVVRFANEDQLASVLAHELVHVLRRHGLRSQRYETLTGSHVERMKLSRALEQEADREAIALVAAAGYAPGECVPALSITAQRMPGTHARTIRTWESHDDLWVRVAAMKTALRALPARSTAQPLRIEPFRRAMDPHRLAAAKLELDAEQFESARALIQEHLERHPDSGPAYALRALVAAREKPEQRLSDPVGADLERAVEYGPQDPEALRALGLYLRDTGAPERSNEMLRRYLASRPDAVDRKLIEGYLARPALPAPPHESLGAPDPSR
ncbi:MAG: M48 family metalloprotease [Myxococcota bacterium]